MRTISLGRCGPRSGIKLVAALVGSFALIVALSIALQAYTQGAAALARARDRATATLILESRVEMLRAGGFAALRPVGVHPFPADQLTGLPGATGTIAVSEGSTPTVRRLRLSLDWQSRSGPAGHEELAFLMSAHGMDP